MLDPNVCPPCGHAIDEHSSLAGCLADDCECMRSPVSAQAANDQAQHHPLDRPLDRDVVEGRAKRDEGLSVVGTTAPGALVTAWRANAEDALSALIAQGGEFSADDVVDRAGMPPRPNMLGAMFMAAARADRINAVGFAQSTRPAARARVQRTWKGA